jgi:uncharacterized delta-60 repeat protein
MSITSFTFGLKNSTNNNASVAMFNSGGSTSYIRDGWQFVFPYVATYVSGTQFRLKVNDINYNLTLSSPTTALGLCSIMNALNLGTWSLVSFDAINGNIYKVTTSNVYNEVEINDVVIPPVSFNTNLGTGFNNNVYSLLIQSDGKILVGGSFTTLNGSTIPACFIRLNTDGTLDTAFNANLGTGFNNNNVHSLSIQSDGKILVGGNFTTLNGSAVPARFIRLNSDGTLDSAFNVNLGTGFDNAIYSCPVQTDGKILLGGYFTTLNGSAVPARFIRLNSDGTLDTAFNTNLGTGLNNTVGSSAINTISVQSDGKILIGGYTSTLNGVSIAEMLTRLNSDGTLDSAFSTNLSTGFDNPVVSITLQSDGKILIGGIFGISPLSISRRFLRLNTNGTSDTAFNANLGSGFNNPVYILSIQSDGKILIGGNFTTLNTIINIPDYFFQLNYDGTVTL